MPKVTVKDTPPASETPPPVPDFLNETPAKRAPGGVPHIPRPVKMSMKPDDFFPYWDKTEIAFPGRCQAYVYRTWPRIDRTILDENASKYIDIWDAPLRPADEWRQEVLHRWGSGDYKLILTDPATRKAVAQTMITNLSDPDYPPVINNLDELVLDFPGNQSYIEQLKQKGILPGEKEMAAGEAMSALTSTIDHLSNKLAEKKESAPAPVTSATDTAKATVEMAGEVFKQGIALGQASVEAQADAKVKAAEAQVAAANPMSSFDTLTKLVALVKDMQPPAKPEANTEAKGSGSLAEFTAMVNSFMGREATLQGKIMEILQAQIASMELRHQAATTQVQTPAQKDDLISSLDKLASMKDKLQGLFGGGESDEKEERVPAWMNLAQSAMSGLPTVATALLGMSYNMAIAKTGSGVPIPPGPIENPALPPAPDSPNPTTGEKPMAANVYATFLSQIERPLINHLNDPTKTGADFADWVSSGFGDIGYQAAKELGKDTLLALLTSRPSIASVIQQIPERTAQFIEEFLTADEIPDEGDDEPPEGVRTFVAPPRGNPQVIDVPPIVQAQKGARPRRKVTPAAG